MGACSQSQQKTNFLNLYKNYSPEIVENHAFAVQQWDYLQRRKRYILQEAKDTLSELVVSLFAPIEELEEIAKAFFKEKFKLSSGLGVSQNTLNRLKLKIQAEMFQVSQQFLQIKTHLSKNLQCLEASIYEFIQEKFIQVQKEIEEKTIRINYTDKMRKELVDEFLLRVRSQSKRKSKNSGVEIQTKFRQLFNQENYLKAYNKVKFNFDPIYSKLENIIDLVQQGRKERDYLKKGKLKLILTQSDQKNIQQILVMEHQSYIKQKQQMKEMKADIKQGVYSVKYRLSQISKKVSEYESTWKKNNKSSPKPINQPATNKIKR